MLPNAPLRIRYPFKSLWAVAVDLAIGISGGGDATGITPGTDFLRRQLPLSNATVIVS